MWPNVGLTEHRRAAGRTELAVHDVATVGLAHIVMQLTGYRDRSTRKHHIRRCITRGKVLAVATSTQSHHDRLSFNAITHCFTQTSAFNGHGIHLLCRSGATPDRFEHPMVGEAPTLRHLRPNLPRRFLGVPSSHFHIRIKRQRHAHTAFDEAFGFAE